MGGQRVEEAASQIYQAGFPYAWRLSPLDLEQVLNSFAIIIYIIRLSILSYCSLLIGLRPKLGYNLKPCMFRAFIRFAAAQLNPSFMDFINLRDSEIKLQLIDELFSMLTQSHNKRNTTV